MTKYRTQSGSIYEVDHVNRQVRSLAKADPARGMRLGHGEWKPFESLDDHGVGHPLYFWWGEGRDEHSHQALQLNRPSKLTLSEEIAKSVQRCTWTSPVVEVFSADAI